MKYLIYEEKSKEIKKAHIHYVMRTKGHIGFEDKDGLKIRNSDRTSIAKACKRLTNQNKLKISNEIHTLL